jgi:hypothetical protein
MTQYKSLVTLLVVATVMLAMIAVAPAAAHESQEIDGYELTFGGSDEPVITGERMWLHLRITDEDGEPVPDQAETLEWRVEKPGEEDAVALDVSEKHGEPGVYEAAVLFTEPGKYTVHMEGTIEGTEVHTHFEKEVEDHTALEYPETDDADEQAVAFPIGPDFGLGVALGAIGAIAAFFIGRRFNRPAPAPG